mgnify:FL=1
MNTLRTFLLTTVLLSLLAPGCASTPKQTAHRTLEAVGLSVQQAMKSAAAGVKVGKLTPEEWERVAKVHDTQFLPAYRTACTLAAQDFTLFAPADVIAIQTQLLNLITQLSQ